MNNPYKKRRMRIGMPVVVMLLFGLVATACLEQDHTANPASMCAFVIGDGNDSHDSKVHNVVYPNQNVEFNEQSEVVRYVPCNSRNYLINNGTLTDANGAQVGDRHVPTVVYTKQGTKINVYSSAYWTLNQSREAMEKFWEFCYKYTCASSDSSAGAANFSTPGWNGMLGENFGQTVDQAALFAAIEIDDAIWKSHDPKLYDELAKQMSAVFAEKMRAKTGYNVDLFCGSGNSGWANPNKPGEGEFTCTNVRFVIDSVEAADQSLVEQANVQTQAELDLEANKQRLIAAQAIYGDDAAYWLALQDTLEKCKAPATCVVNVASPNGQSETPPVVVVPSSTPPSG